MAGHPHLFEDQTDEDFFDKLVDDEFGIGEPSSGVEGMRRGLSDLSLGDIGAHVEDTMSGEVEAREAVGGCTVDAAEADVMSSEDGSSSVVPADSRTFGEAATSAGNFPVAAEDTEPPHPEKHGDSKAGTSVKVVQWSAFSTGGQQQSDLGGFGSFSDFFPEDLGISSDNVFTLPESSATGAETFGADVGPSFDSHGQQDEGQFFNDASQQETYTATSELHDVQQYNPDVTDSLYWENMYPGWKYDHNTNEWYQVEVQEASSNALTDGGSLGTGEAGSQEASYANAYHAANEITSGQGPEVSYLQKGSHNALEAVAESPVTGSVTNWNDFSQGSMQYPSNMVFDPQYPEYYYDTVTMQWYTLESYFQTVQTTTAKDQEQLGNAVSDGYASIHSSSFYDNATKYENYSFTSQNSNEIGSAWTEQASSSYSTGAWQTVVEDKSASRNNFSENQLTGSFHVPSNSLGNFLKSDMGGDFSHQSSWQPPSSGQTGSLLDSSNSHLTSSIHGTTGFMGSTPQSRMSGSSSTQATWQPGTTDQSRMLGGFSESQMISSSSDVTGSMGHFSDKYMDSARNEAILGQGFGMSSGSASFQGFTPTEKLPQFGQSIRQKSQIHETTLSNSYYSGLTSSSYLEQSYQGVNQPFQSGNLSYSQFTSSEGRSSAGRPAHALITFGFGGKLIIMKQTGADLSYASRDANGKTLSILNLADVVTSTSDTSSNGLCGHAYFDSLCKHSFPGPLVSGNAATKDLNKWIDEKISNCVPSSADYKRSKHLRLILSLLKISFQHYGKLRSPFGTDPSVMESGGPESAVTKLFASARESGGHPMDYGSIANCMHNMPTEGQIRTTAVEVQHLLVSGRRQEALQCAQKGLLWGPALVLAAQLGEKFYVDTVRRMAQDQFISGSPLRTLCLLIAGQPADVFSEDGFSNEFSGGAHAPKKAVANGMLDSWEENLAIITANRTKDDELVMVHLGDCLWKERDEIVAAHTCYLVAEANFESYSDSARLCLVGADHWKCPRTYASPDAIQRTELYEYSKVLGNSQFVLLPFQPYKLVYAYMLAEVGKISDSLRYCQAILKILKNSSRAPEIETWKQLILSLEERLKTHQQGGYGSNLAPAKLVGKLFSSIDQSISRMMGSPPSLPPMPHSAIQNNGNDNRHVAPKVSTSQSSMAISSLMPSPSGEKINELTGDSRRIMHNRSVSEPDFGRSPKQGNTGDPSSTDSQSKASNASGPSRIGRLGSQLFQKTIGWVARSRNDRQAKLGDSNKFYYDEKLKRWVEEGVEPPPEEAALPPPPTTSAFQNVGSDYNINSALSQSLSSNERIEAKPTSAEPSSAMPPMPPSTNQFAARGRLGVRSRYVDTFNKGGGVSAASFQAPSAPSVKSISSANFFVPSPIASSQSTGDVTDANAEASSNEDASSLVIKDSPHSSLSSSSSSHSISRFPSVDNIHPMTSKRMGMGLQSNGPIVAPARASSWSGGFPDTLSNKVSDFKPSVDAMSAIPKNPSLLSSGSPSVANGGNLGDELHEVEL